MSDFKRVRPNEDVDPCYGLEEFEISKRDMLALLNGDKLYITVNADEFAILISLEEVSK